MILKYQKYINKRGKYSIDTREEEKPVHQSESGEFMGKDKKIMNYLKHFLDLNVKTISYGEKRKGGSEMSFDIPKTQYDIPKPD